MRGYLAMSLAVHILCTQPMPLLPRAILVSRSRQGPDAGASRLNHEYCTPRTGFFRCQYLEQSRSLLGWPVAWQNKADEPRQPPAVAKSEVPETFVLADDDTIFRQRERRDFDIARSWTRSGHRADVITCSRQCRTDDRRDVLVEQKPHQLFRGGSGFADDGARILDRGCNLLTSEVGVLGDNVGHGATFAESGQDQLDSDACALDYGLAHHDFGIADNSRLAGHGQVRGMLLN